MVHVSVECIDVTSGNLPSAIGKLRVCVEPVNQLSRSLQHSNAGVIGGMKAAHNEVKKFGDNDRESGDCVEW